MGGAESLFQRFRQAAADGAHDLLAGGVGQSVVAAHMGVRAVDGVEMVEEGAVEVEEDGAKTR